MRGRDEPVVEACDIVEDSSLHTENYSVRRTSTAEDSYLQGDPALTTVRGRELTTDEYRRIRQLVEHR
jgi:hypothetical protein